VLQSRNAFLVLCEIMPGVVGLALLINELCRDRFARFDDEDEETGTDNEIPEGLFEKSEEKILRSPSPMGADEYMNIVQRRGLLPCEHKFSQISMNEMGATVDEHPLILEDKIAGDRYWDRRKGKGMEEAVDLLCKSAPASDTPVTLIMVAFTWGVMPRLEKETKRGVL
jgi:hypothetical protein